MKIFYTRKAIHDLERLYDFICKDSPRAATEASEKLRHAIKRLADFPMLGREVKSTENTVFLRDLVTSNYIVRYTILGVEIHILRIWHGKEKRPSI